MEKRLKDINFSEIKGLSKQEINILNSIKERIENGKSAYKKGWSNVSLDNINYLTKNLYHGLNALSLAVAKDEKGYKSSSWLTFNQMGKLNEKIEKEFLKKLEENKVEFKDKDIAVKLCESMNVELAFKNQNKAYYSPENDKIVLPTERQFYSNEEFKRTFFHELSHSTGHEKRLNRDIKKDFGSKEYAFEEIVAESSSIFLSKKFGYLYDENINNSSEYLKSWSNVLINDPKRIINAIQKGNEAKEYIIKHFDELEKILEKNVIIEDIEKTEEIIETIKEETLEVEEIEEEFELEMEI